MRAIAFVAAALLTLVPFAARAQSDGVQRISGQRIALLAAHEVATLPHDTDRGFIAVSMVPDQLVASGRVAMHAESPVGTQSFVNVPVDIDVDGKHDRTIMVGYRVQQFVETAVAARDLTAGTVLADGDVVMARVPFTGVQGNGTDVLLGRRVLSPVLKGQPVAIPSTAVNQIVKAGATVVLIVRDSGVAVTADVIARTGGGLGDQVFVFNPSTHKALSGTVTGPGTVELDISGGDTP